MQFITFRPSTMHLLAGFHSFTLEIFISSHCSQQPALLWLTLILTVSSVSRCEKCRKTQSCLCAGGL